MVVHRLGRQLPLVRVSPETIGVGLMAFVMLATVPFSVWPGGALGTFTDVYFKVVLVFLLMVNSVRSVKALRALSWLILCGHGLRRGARRARLRQRHEPDEGRAPARFDLWADGQLRTTSR